MLEAKADVDRRLALIPLTEGENLTQRVSAQYLIPTPFVVYFLGPKQRVFASAASLTEIICFPSSQ